MFGLVSRQLPQQPPLRKLTSSVAGPLRRLLGTALSVLKLIPLIGTLVKMYEERRRRILDLQIKCIQWRQMQVRRNFLYSVYMDCQTLHIRGMQLQNENISEMEKQNIYDASCQFYREQAKFEFEMLKKEFVYVEKFYENFTDEKTMQKHLTMTFA